MKIAALSGPDASPVSNLKEIYAGRNTGKVRGEDVEEQRCGAGRHLDEGASRVQIQQISWPVFGLFEEDLAI